MSKNLIIYAVGAGFISLAILMEEGFTGFVAALGVAFLAWLVGRFLVEGA